MNKRENGGCPRLFRLLIKSAEPRDIYLLIQNKDR